MSTIFPKSGELTHKWFIVDLKGKILGRAAARVAFYLRGKEKVNFTPNADMGNFIIAINAKDMIIKGDKMEKKFYAKHSGFPQGLRVKTLKQMLDKDPSEVFYEAVKGMMPKTCLGDTSLKKLKVYTDGKHPHEAQKPVPLEI